MRHDRTQAARERLTHQKRLMLSRSDDVAFQKLVDRIARELGTPVKCSHVLRACIVLLHHAERQIVRKARSTALTRPPNERAIEIAEFEKQLARLLLEVLREAPKM